jgi:membrane protein implicated in regulation of membrane protease activity
MRKFTPVLALALAITMSAGTAHAYIGPGLGAGVIGTVLGILGSIFLALGAVLYYPVKRFMRRRREAREIASNQDRR